MRRGFDVALGYTPRRRSVTNVPFWTPCDGESYDAVAVTQGGGSSWQTCAGEVSPIHAVVPSWKVAR